jgi:hypothetical protein
MSWCLIKHSDKCTFCFHLYVSWLFNSWHTEMKVTSHCITLRIFNTVFILVCVYHAGLTTGFSSLNSKFWSCKYISFVFVTYSFLIPSLLHLTSINLFPALSPNITILCLMLLYHIWRPLVQASVGRPTVLINMFIAYRCLFRHMPWLYDVWGSCSRDCEDCSLLAYDAV